MPARRRGTTVAPIFTVITLFLSGDVMLGRGIDQILAEPCDPELYEPSLHDARDYVVLAEEVSGPIPRRAPPDYPWGDALAVLDAAHPDARIVNLETAITRRGDPDRDKQIHYRTSPENARTLAAARIDVCTLGNNHVLDWGSVGLADTLAALDRLGIARCGAGRDRDDAFRPAVIELGERGGVAVFSIGCADAGVPSWWAAGADRPGVCTAGDLGEDTRRRLRDAIAPWRRPGTLVVLSIHWGANWGHAIEATHRRFAREMIDGAGVDVVHGHSSHHVKGIEVHHGRPILYGCGDLLSDYEGISGYEAYRGELGLLYLATFDDGGALFALEMTPTRTRRFRIAQAGPDDARWLATTLARAGGNLGTSIAIEGAHLALRW